MKKITRGEFLRFLGLFSLLLFIPRLGLGKWNKRVSRSHLYKKHKLAG